MVGWQLRLTPKQAAAKFVVAIIGLAVGAYGVATVYKPLQVSTYRSCCVKGFLKRECGIHDMSSVVTIGFVVYMSEA